MKDARSDISHFYRMTFPTIHHGNMSKEERARLRGSKKERKKVGRLDKCTSE
jgi:hypothetical protein